MTEPLQICLPVMMHKEAEVEAFQKAKERIERLGESFPIRVGAFLYFLEQALTPQNMEAGIANQKKHRLPIVHCQAPVQGQHSLVYTSADAKKFGKQGLLETSVDYCAALREYSSLDYPAAVDVHSGVYVFQDLQDDGSLPSFFSVNSFIKRRGELLTTAKDRFQQLTEYARGRGLGFVLENEISAALCPSKYSNGEPKMHFMPFTARDAMNFIAGESQTFDTAHYGAS